MWTKNGEHKPQLGWLAVGCVLMLLGCSSIPGFRSEPEDEGADVGQRLYLQVSAEEALDILTALAPEHGWEVKSIGNQYDLTGPRGKYFRLEAQRLLGGPSEMSGVFFSDPKGSYVLVGKREMGLPEDLVAPLKSAIEAESGAEASQP